MNEKKDVDGELTNNDFLYRRIKKERKVMKVEGRRERKKGEVEEGEEDTKEED